MVASLGKEVSAKTESSSLLSLKENDERNDNHDLQLDQGREENHVIDGGGPEESPQGRVVWQSMEAYLGFPDTPRTLRGDSGTLLNSSRGNSGDFGWFSSHTNHSLENLGMFEEVGRQIDITPVTTMESNVSASGRTSREASETKASDFSHALNTTNHGFRRRGDRMSEINQWHYLYQGVSSAGDLAVPHGRYASLHVCRSHFALSTRHFPIRSGEHPMNRGEGGAFPLGTAGGSSVNTGSPQKEDATLAAAVKRASMGRAGRRKSTKCFAWALTEIRVVAGGPLWVPPHAEYLIVACLGGSRLVAAWRRSTDFEKLAACARKNWMPKACVVWQALQRARGIERCGGGDDGCNLLELFLPRRLGEAYICNKARFLEEFLKQFVFEAPLDTALMAFLDLGVYTEL
ncbi:unnamed protein product [Discosporangium mesarthrocarpum]